jgi:hypothetical protein
MKKSSSESPSISAGIVRFDDKLVYHGSYQLSARAIKTICYIASRYVDAENAEGLLRPIFVPIKELSKALSEGRGGDSSNSLYESLQSLCEELATAKIRFRTSVRVEGRDLSGYISWCSDVVPEERNGVQGINFCFGVYMSQFLINLSRYVTLYRPELNRLNSSYSIRLFQMLKGVYNKKQKYNKVLREVYSIDHLRYLMSVEEKYKDFRFFNRDILKSAVQEINDNTSIYVLEMRKLRGPDRRTSHIELLFTDNRHKQARIVEDPASYGDYQPSEADVASLSFAERKAYELLLDFKVRPGIAFKRILPDIGGSESAGFEDYFISGAIAHFRANAANQTTKEQSAATFVNWWVKMRLFDTNTPLWSEINERVVRDRKKLATNDPSAFENRLRAREMTHDQFVGWWKVQQG